jgi:hypothetical protein
MCKPVLAILCASFMALTLSGCFGLATYLPDECKNETPTTSARLGGGWKKAPLSSMPTKADFLRAWGKPNMITSTSENTETWIYERHLWCGVMPAFILAVPLLLPVCDGFERIEFQGDDAKRLHIRRIVESGYILLIFPIGGGADYISVKEPACRRPIHNNGGGSDATQPAAQIPP